MGGYFESKRLKLPQTSTTAELHRPLTLSQRALEYCIGARSMLMDLLSREYTRTQIERRRMYIQTSQKRIEKEEKEKCMLSRLLSMMSLHLSPLLPERGGNLVTPRPKTHTYNLHRLPIEHSNLRHMKRSNLPVDLFLKNKSELFFPSSLPFHCPFWAYLR